MSKTKYSPHWTSREAAVVLPRCRTDVIERELEGEAILYDPVNDHIHRFNPTAFAVWQLCDGRATTRQIAEQLTEVYDLAFEPALDHVEQLVTLFCQLQLLDLSGDSQKR